MPHAHPTQQTLSVVPCEVTSVTRLNDEAKMRYGHRPYQSSLYPSLQGLLLWQSLSLFWLCGLFLPKMPMQVFCLALLFFSMDARLRQKSAAFMAVCLLLLGAVNFMKSVPKRPEPAAWTMQKGVPVSLLLEGEVVRVRSLPQGRVQVILQDLTPVAPHLTQYKALEGLAVWTWEWTPSFIKNEGRGLSYPLPGQKVRITAKVRTTESYRNRWGSDFGFYWQSQGVFWRLWTRDTMGKPFVFGHAHTWAQLRQDVLHRLEKTIKIAQKRMSEGEGSQKDARIWQALAFLPALLLGERFALAHTTYENMQALSLVHSLALSGQHLAFAGLLAWGVMQGISYCFPYAFLHIPRQKLFILCSLPFALLYLWLGNAPPSLVRAFVMLVLFSVILWRYTVANLASVLWATICFVTLLSPLALYHVGLQLSVLCVGSICLVEPLLRRIKCVFPLQRRQNVWQRLRTKTSRFFLQIFLISLSIQWVLLPVMLLYFEPSGLWFMANLVWLPVLGFWVLPWGALALFLSYVGQWDMAAILAHWAVVPCEALLSWAEFMKSRGLLDFSAVLRPHWSSVLAWVPLMVGLALLPGRISWKDARKGQASIPQKIQHLFFLAAVLLCVGPVLRYVQYRDSAIGLEMFDVGYGQAVAISFGGGQRVLVDGAGSFSSSFDSGTRLVLPSLVYNEAPRLWAMINSHPDVDHVRGLMHMLAHFSPELFYTNGEEWGAYEQKLWKNMGQKKILPVVQALSAGQSISLPVHGASTALPLTLEVLWPPAGGNFTDNNASLILRLVQGQGAQRVGLALLCGDAEASALRTLLASGKDVSAKVIVLPHHGALDGYVPQLYDAVGASVALASVGRQNAYGHPHHMVRKALEGRNITLYTTAKDGAIQLVFTEGELVRTVRNNTHFGHLPF